MIRVTQDLRDEHETLQRVMEVLEKLINLGNHTELDLNQIQNEIVYFLRTFVDKCHHGKEEGILFPAMIKASNTLFEASIRFMLQDHTKGRELVNSMNRAAKHGDTVSFNLSAAAYRELLIPHIEKENHILFEMADRTIPENKWEALLWQYDEHEENVIGPGVHEKLHELIEKWDEQIESEEENLRE